MDGPKPMRELTRIREERGLSQQALADASGVNKATINQIERGRRSPNLETLEKLAGALAVEMADFFPKAQASLLLESAQRSEGGGSGRDVPHYTAFEAFGRALASGWEEDLQEWDEKMPEGKWADSWDFARLVQWAIEIAGTKGVYQAVVREMGTPLRTELADTMQLLDEANRAAIKKVLRAYEPAKTFEEFQQIWKANDLDALASEAERR